MLGHHAISEAPISSAADGGTITLVILDVGASTDSATFQIRPVVSDVNGVVTDVITSIQIIVPITVNDSGSASEEPLVLMVSVPVADFGTVTEAITDLLTSFAVNESYAGVDSLLLQNSFAVPSDSSVGVDSVPAITNLFEVGDVGDVVDVLTTLFVSFTIENALTVIDIPSIHHVFSVLTTNRKQSPQIKFYLLKRDKVFQPGIRLYLRQELGNVGSLVVTDYKKLVTTITDRATDTPV